MLNSPATRWHWGFHFLINEAMQGKHWEEDVGPGLQSNSSNCLVLIPHRQMGNYLPVTGESYSPTAQHMQDWIWVNVWHLPREDLLTEAQHITLYRVLVPIHSSNVRGKMVSSQCRNFGPVTCLQDWHQGNTSHQGCRSFSPCQENPETYVL